MFHRDILESYTKTQKQMIEIVYVRLLSVLLFYQIHYDEFNAAFMA